MKHLAAILAAVALAALGFYIVIVNAKGITMTHLIGGGVAIAFALALAIPAQAGQAVSLLARLAALARGKADPGPPSGGMDVVG